MAYYLHNDDLLFELTICKFKGEVSDTLSHYFYLIADNMKHKPQFKLKFLHEDQVQEAYTRMMEQWNNVNLLRNPDSVFPYFSEITKRSYVNMFNIYFERKPQNNFNPLKFSIDTTENLY